MPRTPSITRRHPAERLARPPRTTTLPLRPRRQGVLGLAGALVLALALLLLGTATPVRAGNAAQPPAADRSQAPAGLCRG